MLRLLSAFLFAIVVATSSFAAPVARSTGGCYGGPNLPLDAGVAGVTAAYGTCALTKNWLNRSFADVVANGVTYTIGFINGAPDTRKLAQLMGNINPKFGTGGLPLAKWYDQTGNGNDCVQATSANRMSVWLVNGKVSINGDGYFFKFISSSAQDRNCSAPLVSINSQASTFFFAGRPFQFGTPMLAGTGTGVLAQPGVGCCGGAAGAGFQMGGSASNNGVTWPASNFFTFSWDGFAGPTNTQSWPESQPSVIGTIFSATTVTWTQNEETPTNCGGACALVAETSTGITIGSDSGNGGQAGGGSYAGFQAYLIFGAATLSGGNQTTIRNALYATFNIPSTQNYSITVDGASFDIAQGGLIGGVQGYGWAEQMRARIPYPVRFINLAASGDTIANLTTAWANMTALPCVGSFTKNILIGPNSAPGNSISSGRTGAQAFSDLQAYLTAVRARCTYDTIIVATLPANGGEVANYNALVKANAVTLSITVADWAADSVMGVNFATNPVLFNQVSPYTNHPTIAGYSYLATDTLGPLRAAIGQ